MSKTTRDSVSPTVKIDRHGSVVITMGKGYDVSSTPLDDGNRFQTPPLLASPHAPVHSSSKRSTSAIIADLKSPGFLHAVDSVHEKMQSLIDKQQHLAPDICIGDLSHEEASKSIHRRLPSIRDPVLKAAFKKVIKHSEHSEAMQAKLASENVELELCLRKSIHDRANALNSMEEIAHQNEVMKSQLDLAYSDLHVSKCQIEEWEHKFSGQAFHRMKTGSTEKTLIDIREGTVSSQRVSRLIELISPLYKLQESHIFVCRASDLVRDLLDADVGIFYLYKSAEKELWTTIDGKSHGIKIDSSSAGVAKAIISMEPQRANYTMCSKTVDSAIQRIVPRLSDDSATVEYLSLPVVADDGGDVVGALETFKFTDTGERGYSNEDCFLAKCIASNLAQAYMHLALHHSINTERVSLGDEIRKEVNLAVKEKDRILEKRNSFIETSRSMRMTTDEEQLFLDISKQAAVLLKGEDGILLFYDKQKNSLFSHIPSTKGKHIDRKSTSALWKAFDEKDKPFIITSDKQSMVDLASLLSTTVNCMVCTSIADEDHKVFGILVVVNKINGADFDRDDGILLNEFSLQIALIIYHYHHAKSEKDAHTLSKNELMSLKKELVEMQNLLKFEKENAIQKQSCTQRLLHMAKAVTSHLELEHVFKAVMDDAHNLLQADRAVLYLYEKE